MVCTMEFRNKILKLHHMKISYMENMTRWRSLSVPAMRCDLKGMNVDNHRFLRRCNYLFYVTLYT